jgi:hypothetical protein
MKLLVFYRTQSEFATPVESFLRDLGRERDVSDKLEVIDPDSREGTSKIRIYDIMQFPTLLVVDDFGSIVHSWSGEQLPMTDEVLGYLGS